MSRTTIASMLVLVACEAGSAPPAETQCSYEGMQVPDGEEFEDVDGCHRFRCNRGAAEVVRDDTIVLEGDLELETQEALEDIELCVIRVEGSVRIGGTVVDTTRLHRLTSVGGDLVVEGAAMEHLDFNGSLGEVGGDLVLADNANLTSMAFRGNMNVFGETRIENNDALPSLAGAGFLSFWGARREPGDSGDGDGGAAPDDVPGALLYGALVIADNDVLADVTAMSDLTSALDDVIVRNNPALEAFPGLMLYEIQGDLEISEHPRLDTALVTDATQHINVVGETRICGNLDGTPCPE